MYDMIWYWLNLWLNPLRVSPLIGGRWVFLFSIFRCVWRGPYRCGNSRTWGSFWRQTRKGTVDIGGRSPCSGPVEWSVLWVIQWLLHHWGWGCQVVCPHCGGLAPVTETPQIKRLRRSIGSLCDPQRQWWCLGLKDFPTLQGVEGWASTLMLTLPMERLHFRSCRWECGVCSEALACGAS